MGNGRLSRHQKIESSYEVMRDDIKENIKMTLKR